MLGATGCSSSGAAASADQSLLQHGQGPEELAAALAAHLQHDRAQQLDDMAEVLLDSEIPLSALLEAPASKGRHELLAALLRRAEQRSSSSGSSGVFPPPVPELSTAWLAAAEKGHARCLGLILDTCKQRPTALKELLEGVGEGRDTALMLASRTDGPGQLECMRLLLEHSPDAQVTNVFGGRYNALMYAAKYNNAAGMELLLAHSPKQQVAAKSWNGMALMHAARNGSVSCLQLLLVHSPDAQLAVESWGANALSAAAGFLLEVKACCLADGGSDHQHKLAAGRECVELLVAHGAQLPDRVSEELRGAFWPIVQEAVRRARVPDMANAAVVGLALAVAGRSKKPAEGQEGGAVGNKF